MRYSNDPRWITVRYASVCRKCKAPINPPTGKAFYYPQGKTLLCEAEDCGKQAARDFEAARFDEEGY